MLRSSRRMTTGPGRRVDFTLIIRVHSHASVPEARLAGIGGRTSKAFAKHCEARGEAFISEGVRRKDAALGPAGMHSRRPTGVKASSRAVCVDDRGVCDSRFRFTDTPERGVTAHSGTTKQRVDDLRNESHTDDAAAMRAIWSAPLICKCKSTRCRLILLC